MVVSHQKLQIWLNFLSSADLLLPQLELSLWVVDLSLCFPAVVSLLLWIDRGLYRGFKFFTTPLYPLWSFCQYNHHIHIHSYIFMIAYLHIWLTCWFEIIILCMDVLYPHTKFGVCPPSIVECQPLRQKDFNLPPFPHWVISSWMIITSASSPVDYLDGIAPLELYPHWVESWLTVSF
jgi:hypothetical protein